MYNLEDLEPIWEEEQEEISISRVEKEIDYKNLLIELAYHEASHFVFDQLILKMNLGFSNVTRMFVHCEKENKTIDGVVTGLSGDITNIHSFYRQDPRRTYARLFTTLAGYVSRMVFIDDDIFFISEADLINYTDGKLFYYSLEIAPRTISDIRKTRDYLNNYLRVERNQQNEKIFDLIKDIQALMKRPAMNLAIRYVKNILIENNGTEIIGQKLESVRWKTDILLSKISLEDTISKYL